MIEKFSPNGACCRARSDRLQRVAMIDLTRNFYFVYGVLTIIGAQDGNRWERVLTLARLATIPVHE